MTRPRDLDATETVSTVPYPLPVPEDCEDCRTYTAYWRVTWEPSGTEPQDWLVCHGCCRAAVQRGRDDTAGPIFIERITYPHRHRTATVPMGNAA